MRGSQRAYFAGTRSPTSNPVTRPIAAPKAARKGVGPIMESGAGSISSDHGTDSGAAEGSYNRRPPRQAFRVRPGSMCRLPVSRSTIGAAALVAIPARLPGKPCNRPRGRSPAWPKLADCARPTSGEDNVNPASIQCMILMLTLDTVTTAIRSSIRGVSSVKSDIVSRRGALSAQGADPKHPRIIRSIRVTRFCPR